VVSSVLVSYTVSQPANDIDIIQELLYVSPITCVLMYACMHVSSSVQFRYWCRFMLATTESILQNHAITRIPHIAFL
jgi:hypothetical protein